MSIQMSCRSVPFLFPAPAMTNKETKNFFAAAAVQVALFNSQRRLKQDLDLVGWEK
jgi:hypothetical protein